MAKVVKIGKMSFVTGPRGSGKSTLAKKLLASKPGSHLALLSGDGLLTVTEAAGRGLSGIIVDVDCLPDVRKHPFVKWSDGKSTGVPTRLLRADPASS